MPPNGGAMMDHQPSTSGKNHNLLLHHHQRRRNALCELISSIVDTFRCAPVASEKKKRKKKQKSTYTCSSKVTLHDIIEERKQSKSNRKGLFSLHASQQQHLEVRVEDISTQSQPMHKICDKKHTSVTLKQEDARLSHHKNEQQLMIVAVKRNDSDEGWEQKKKLVLVERQSSKKDNLALDLQWCVKQLKFGKCEQQEKAAAQVRMLTKDDPQNRDLLSQLGAIPLLVTMLDSFSSSTSALLALLNLAIGNDRNKASIVEAGAVSKIVKILNSGNRTSQESAAAAFLSISALDSNKAIIGQSGAVNSLLRILKSSTTSAQCKKDSLRALYNLSICSSNTSIFLSAGAVQSLLELIPEGELTEKTLAALGNLVAASDQARKEVCSSKRGLQLIIEALTNPNFSSSSSTSSSSDSSSSSSSKLLPTSRSPAVKSFDLSVDSAGRCQERAVYLLMVIAHHSFAARRAMVRAGAVSALLEVALLGSAIAQRRASRLLDSLREDSHPIRPVSAPMSILHQGMQVRGTRMHRKGKEEECEEEEEEDKQAVTWMVKQSLQRNMERMVRRARLPSLDLDRTKTFGSSSSSRSLPVQII